MTASIFDEEGRKSADFKALRVGLGYGWRVAVAALPELGRCRMEKRITSGDRDIRWVMAQNLRKKRLVRMDEDWVNTQLEALGSLR